MNPVFVDTSVLIAAENVGGGALYVATLDWLDLLWRRRSGRTQGQGAARMSDQLTFDMTAEVAALHAEAGHPLAPQRRPGVRATDPETSHKAARRSAERRCVRPAVGCPYPLRVEGHRG